MNCADVLHINFSPGPYNLQFIEGLVLAIDVYFLVRCKFCAQLYATNFSNKTFICTFLQLFFFFYIHTGKPKKHLFLPDR